MGDCPVAREWKELMVEEILMEKKKKLQAERSRQPKQRKTETKTSRLASDFLWSSPLRRTKKMPLVPFRLCRRRARHSRKILLFALLVTTASSAMVTKLFVA